MTHAHVEELRRKLVGDGGFGGTWDYFLTHFAEKPQFLQRGKQAPSEPFINCIGECYKRTGPAADFAVLRNFIAVSVPEFKMNHGAFQMDGHWCGFVYFTDLDMGLVCFSNATTGQSTMARFHTNPQAMQGLSSSSTGVQ